MTVRAVGSRALTGTFYKRHEPELRRLHTFLKEELLGDIIPFWESRILDPESPGYLIGYDSCGNLTDTRKHGWFVGRTMYQFSALYNEVEQREAWFEIARAGRLFMDGSFYAGNGRFQKTVSREGEVLEGTTSIFTDHFLVKGLYQYILALKNRQEAYEEDLQLAKFLTEKLFRHSRDPMILKSEGIPGGFQKHAVNFMNLIVALEARKVFGSAYDTLLDTWVRKSLYEFANDQYLKAFEYIGPDGKPILTGPGRLMDPGHTMESLWFSMEAGRQLNRPDYIRRAGDVVDWVIESCFNETYGGFYQHADVLSGTPEAEYRSTMYGDIPVSWDDKIWWVQAECLTALAYSALYNENETHMTYFKKQLDYAETYFHDKAHGEWYSILHRDGSMAYGAKGFELKGPYHVPRCLMQLMTIIETYLNRNL